MNRRVLLKVALSPFTGYGRDGIGLAQALTDAGWEVTLAPHGVQPPLPPQVAMLLTVPVRTPFHLLLHHAEPSALGLTEGERRAAMRSVAWTMWEFTGLGGEFEGEMGDGRDGLPRTFPERLSTYDEILVYDEVSREAIGRATDTPIRKLQGGYNAEEWEADPRQRDWSGTFRFCMVGQLHDRKNPWATAQAFNILREKLPEADVELHMKSSIKTLHPKMEEAYPGLKIHYATWDHQQMLAFYLSCHCLVAPSWGEGKNLPALEAMTTGMPVIVTDFGGHAEWAGSAEAYRVPFHIEEHQPGMGSARVTPEDLAEQMLQVYLDRAEARQRGERASRLVPAMMDWSTVVTRLGDMLGNN